MAPYVKAWAQLDVWVPPGRPGRPGRPVDPGFGVEEGAGPGQGLPGGEPGFPDQGLPGGGEYPDQGLPGFPVGPDQGLPPGWFIPERPGHGLPHPGRPVDPGWGVDEGAGVGIPGFPDQGFNPDYPSQGPVRPGYPGRPGQGLPWVPPGRPVRGYPIVPTPEDLGGHQDLPDLNMPGQWGRVRPPKGLHSFPAWIVFPHEGPPVDDHEARYPEKGRPGAWNTVALGTDFDDVVLAWAWLPDPPHQEEIEPEDPDHGEPEVDPIRAR